MKTREGREKEECFLRRREALIFFHLLLQEPEKVVESAKTSSQSIMAERFTAKLAQTKRNINNRIFSAGRWMSEDRTGQGRAAAGLFESLSAMTETRRATRQRQRQTESTCMQSGESSHPSALNLSTPRRQTDIQQSGKLKPDFQISS
eukprot:scaffold198_cov169-Ochromonas_danica.AAC.9